RPRQPTRPPRPALSPARRPAAESLAQLDSDRDRPPGQRDGAACHLQALPRDLTERTLACAAATDARAAVVAKRPRAAPSLAADAAPARRLPPSSPRASV